VDAPVLLRPDRVPAQHRRQVGRAADEVLPGRSTGCGQRHLKSSYNATGLTTVAPAAAAAHLLDCVPGSVAATRAVDRRGGPGPTTGGLGTREGDWALGKMPGTPARCNGVLPALRSTRPTRPARSTRSAHSTSPQISSLDQPAGDIDGERVPCHLGADRLP